MAIHLSRCGWNFRVVTIDPAFIEPSHIDRSANEISGIGRILTGYSASFLTGGFVRSKLQYRLPYLAAFLRRIAKVIGVDDGVGWKKHIIKACVSLSPADIDLILATGPPFTAFTAAGEISNRLNCPFVLDYRDAWTLEPHRKNPMPEWIKRKELQLLKKATAVFAVSMSMAAALEETFLLGKKVSVISNGFDPQDCSLVPKTNFGHPAIIYAGSFYPPNRIVDPIITCLKIFNTDSLKKEMGFRFHYYGPDSSHVMGSAMREKVSHLVVDHGKVSRTEVLGALKAAVAAVVITSVQPSNTLWEKGVITGKIFEAIATRTPIVLISPKGSDARAVVEETGSGRCFESGEEKGMVDYLVALATGHCILNFRGVEKYEWSAIAAKMDKILRQCLEG